MFSEAVSMCRWILMKLFVKPVVLSLTFPRRADRQPPLNLTIKLHVYFSCTRPSYNSVPLRLDTDASMTDQFPVIFLNFSSSPPYYPNRTTLTYFSSARVPQALELLLHTHPHTHTPLKRIIYMAQVWDQSHFGGTIEYTNLRSDISLAVGGRAVSAAERDRE